MRIRLAAALAAALTLAAPAALVQAAPTTPAVVKVTIGNFTFGPKDVVVRPGATVTWINDDDIPHTVVSDDHVSFKSKVLDTGQSFSFTFVKPGTFQYFCSLHPHMTGKVVVQ